MLYKNIGFIPVKLWLLFFYKFCFSFSCLFNFLDFNFLVRDFLSDACFKIRCFSIFDSNGLVDQLAGSSLSFCLFFFTRSVSHRFHWRFCVFRTSLGKKFRKRQRGGLVPSKYMPTKLGFWRGDCSITGFSKYFFLSSFFRNYFWLNVLQPKLLVDRDVVLNFIISDIFLFLRARFDGAEKVRLLISLEGSSSCKFFFFFFSRFF